MHTIEQVKVLLAAAECLPGLDTINFTDDGKGEGQYRRAVDVLDALGMLVGCRFIESEGGGFETVTVVDAETGDRLCSLYGPYNVRVHSPIEQLAGKVLQIAPSTDDGGDVECSHRGCTASARRIIAGRPVCSDPEHQDAAANGPHLEPVA